MNPHFRTLTFKWCFFLNLLITNWKIPPMLNSLLICQPINTKKQRNIKLSTIDVCRQIYIQKPNSISLNLVFHDTQQLLGISPQIETKITNSIEFIGSLHSCKLFHVSSKRHCTSCLPFPIPFIWCGVASIDKSINDWTLDSACWVDIRNLCVPLFQMW